MKESKAMVKKEIDFMKKKGAPASMIKHEKGEAKMASGGMHKMPDGKMMKDSDMKKMACGGKTTKMARGGGIEKTGKTDGKMVKMAKGGSVSKRADGIASRGKTNCKVM